MGRRKFYRIRNVNTEKARTWIDLGDSIERLPSRLPTTIMPGSRYLLSLQGGLMKKGMVEREEGDEELVCSYQSQGGVDKVVVDIDIYGDPTVDCYPVGSASNTIPFSSFSR